MNPAVANNQLIPGEEASKFAAYSLAVHNAIGMINIVILATLQILSNLYSMSLMTVSIYYGVLIIYAVFGVGEVIGGQLEPVGSVRRFFGHSSHFIGALAAIWLISVVNVVFACVILALLLFIWIPAVVLTQVMKKESRTAGLPQLPPV